LGPVLLAGPVFAQRNPPSEVIASLTIHPERISVGNGDNWPITWADDGNQYTVYSCFPKGPYQLNLQKCVLETSEK
jgi:hypothetical protein